jgi:hypothetical protein
MHFTERLQLLHLWNILEGVARGAEVDAMWFAPPMLQLKGEQLGGVLI